MCSSFSFFFIHLLCTQSNDGHFNIPDKTVIIIMMEQPTSDEKKNFFIGFHVVLIVSIFERLANTHSITYTQFFFLSLYNVLMLRIHSTLYTNTKGLYTDKFFNRIERKIEGANRQHDKLITNMETSISWVSIKQKYFLCPHKYLLFPHNAGLPRVTTIIESNVL